jgi:hypothetical protein
LIVHASEYEQKPVYVTKGADDHMMLAAHNMRTARADGCRQRTVISGADQRAKGVARTWSGLLTPL